jgi:transposase
MEYYAGIDVSLEQSSVCIVDAKGKIVREAKVASEPGPLIRWLKSQGVDLARIAPLSAATSASRRVATREQR